MNYAVGKQPVDFYRDYVAGFRQRHAGRIVIHPSHNLPSLLNLEPGSVLCIPVFQVSWHRSLGQAAFRGRNRDTFSESWMRETRLSSSMSGLCQEDEKSSCCTKDEGWPFGVAL